jgi:predicted acetyltransferase
LPGGVLIELEVRRVADLDEFETAFLAIGQYFGIEPKRERIEKFVESLPLERMHAAWEDGAIVGGAGSFPFELSIPGGSARCAGVSVVGVHPTHRRRGVLRAMMRAQLDEVRERSEPIAALWASEETIYGRFGYGMAALAGDVSLAREHSEYAFPLARRGQVRLVDPEEALVHFPVVWERLFAETPGVFRRERPWWENRTLADPPDRRDGGGPKRLALLELAGEPAAYAIYRHNAGWEDGSSSARLGVVEAIGADRQATAELWRFLLDIDWQATVSASLLPVDHPLFFLLAKPRRLKYRLGDGIWLRLVDVGQALSARGYAQDGELVLDVADAFCPWNEGVWKLADGRCERTDDEPDLRCDVSALGSVYLGGFTFEQLRSALRVEELRPGAVDRADAIFRSSRAPWCPEIF